MRNVSTALVQRKSVAPVVALRPASRHKTSTIILEPEIRRPGEAAIRQLIASEAKSEFPNMDAIRRAKDLLADLELLPPTAEVPRDQFVIFANGIAAVSRLIALRLADRRPDVDAIARASWFIADLADLVEEELDRGV
ncbi:hypothetical protein [Cupriavidus numazuensis]|uniref:Uncharacterized protein n=1 Tax=Cupriavidus numazuensis TaxID=221992 RepID=A0ABM8TCG4_9BURK|nr:hypothetical protein [Cupriavidus numazuensis]CAG2136073.1 hypothetical protein LMG26411_01191 [Cupriavidus numazuensis]